MGIEAVKEITVSKILSEIEVKPSIEAEKLAERYGYLAYMVERYIRILGDDAENLLRAMEKPSILKPTVRCNQLRVNCRWLENRLRSLGFELRPLEWALGAYEVVRSPPTPSIGATHEYLKGYYYLHRDPSPLIAPLNMDLGPGLEVLDTCAAPGGKATYIAQLIEDRGLVVANDISLNRIRALVSNIARMGFRSIAVMRGDARRIHRILAKKFERILVDAPCSAEGYIMFDPSRKRKTGEKELAALVKREIEILASAIELLESGGILVYSTCSIAPEENEYVISKILRIYNKEIEIIDPRIDIWSRGIHGIWIKDLSPDVRKCIRTWPHKHHMGGSFVCILRKK
jgi:NOL1/NOP2/sun family putative RNA methylase